MNRISVNLESIPEPLKRRSQWVCWRYARPRDGSTHRWCKLPVSPITGRHAKTTSASTWSDFDTAVACFNRNQSSLAGIGFVFSRDDPFIGIDLDNCRNDRSGELSPWARTLVDEFDSYTEVSPSGKGVKCILSSSAQVQSRRKSSPGIEVYSAERYFTITGQAVDDRLTINDRTTQFLDSYRRLFPVRPQRVPSPNQLRHFASDVPDEAVLNRALKAKNGWKFKKLWNGDLSLHADNASEADLALCRILAFWCGPNPEQIDRLFRRSQLHRPKWDKQHYADGTTYGQRTLEKAIIAQGETFYCWQAGMRGKKLMTVG